MNPHASPFRTVDPGELVPSEFLLRLPKAELHLHLEGAIDAATLNQLRRTHGEQELESAEIARLYKYQDFNGFLMAFKTVTEQLRTAEDYELVTYRMMERLRAENVLHAEVYISVGVCLWRGYDFEPLFEGMERGRQRGERDFGVSLLWIFDAVRHFGPRAARCVADKAVQLRDRHPSIVGFGIGGDERRAAPEIFQEVYAFARERGLHLVAHAGETAGPESIWGALNLRAERIGHALTAWQDRELMAVLLQRQVPIEICITSNLRTGCCGAIERHPLRMYFDVGLMLTLNSDDPAMFGTSLSREYQLAQTTFDFSNEHLRELARNSFEASFLPPERKLELLHRIDNMEK